jgi:hypothetical protein
LQRKYFLSGIKTLFLLQQTCYFSSLNNCLKKIASILLLLVFLFNLFGYQFVISFLQYKADQKIESRIDNNEYDEASLIEMRIPLNMPYQERYTDFERHYGEINIEGKAYTYVKRKIEGDVLILKCIPNESKQQLKETSNDLTKANTGQDKENNTGKKTNSLLKVFGGDYDNNNQFAQSGLINLSVNTIFTSYAAALQTAVIQTPDQPPKQC